MDGQEENVGMPEFDIKNDVQEQDELIEDLDSLQSIETQINESGDLGVDIATEADTCLGSDVFVKLRYDTPSRIKRKQAALESIGSSIWEMLVKIYESFVKMIRKMIDFVFGNSRPQGANIALSGKEIADTIHEMNKNLTASGAMKLLENPPPEAATEDMPVGIRQGSLFDGFTDSLDATESDFLTSGKRYLAVKNAIGDFTRAHFKNYVDGVRGDFTKWMDKMLHDAHDLKNYPNRTDDFRKDAMSTITKLRDSYKVYVEDIESIDTKYLHVSPGLGPKALNTFQHSPNSLAIYLEDLWKSIAFERIKDTDRELATSLKDLEKALNREITMLTNRKEDAATKGEESVFRLAIAFQKDTVRHVGELVKLTTFIFASARSGFYATNKAFSYLIRIFTAIGQADPSKKAAVESGITEIGRRRDDLIATINGKKKKKE